MRAVRNAGSSGFYSNIRRICDERHITIAELERKAGLGNGVVRKWDNASPTLRTAIAVADYLGVTLDDLVRGGAGGDSSVSLSEKGLRFSDRKTAVGRNRAFR
ncbi:MAG: helix-turn-helix transcriptional regulator [Oscillospiraceae bacterium]|nr:helix-turn-helix transcriptional regulator [Oscillospiraceae bacterium]